MYCIHCVNKTARGLSNLFAAYFEFICDAIRTRHFPGLETSNGAFDFVFCHIINCLVDGLWSEINYSFAIIQIAVEVCS